MTIMCKAHSQSVPNLLLDQTLVWNGSVCLGCTSQYYFEHEVATSITILQDIPKILQRILLPKNYQVSISFPSGISAIFGDLCIKTVFSQHISSNIWQFIL